MDGIHIIPMTENEVYSIAALKKSAFLLPGLRKALKTSLKMRMRVFLLR